MSSAAKKQVLIVGGVAGGASCAARLRRLDEQADIHLFDRGPHVSFANCGLPYYVGDVIKARDSLLVATPQLFKDQFNVSVHVKTEVIDINRESKTLTVRNVDTRNETAYQYDTIVLATGAVPITPPIPGLRLPGVFTIRTIPDSDAVRAWISEHNAKSAVVVGGGFIGLEMAENLHNLGLKVTVLEGGAHMLPPIDSEMAYHVHEQLKDAGMEVVCSDPVKSIDEDPADGSDRLHVQTANGKTLPADLVIMSIGIKPDSRLASAAGLELGTKGAVKVNKRMQSVTDPAVYAVGDVTEVLDFCTGKPTNMALAGPANREGRIAAANIAGLDEQFRGVQGTAVTSIFGLVVASTGMSEDRLRREGIEDYDFVYIHPGQHVEYYPGACRIHMKMLFNPKTGKIYGAQAVGGEGTEKRIDVISTVIQLNGTIHDLAEAELCYSPQFGAAKDPVNVLGMVAANSMRRAQPHAHWRDYSPDANITLVDVREPHEYEENHVPNAINVPLSKLRAMAGDLIPKDGRVWLYCIVGQRSYTAMCALENLGYTNVRTISGGITSYPSDTAWQQ